MWGIYIGFPFCRQKCTFCNFASGVFGAELRGAYLEALRDEIEASAGVEADTLYLGGGSPSLLNRLELEALLEPLGREWQEATIEVAPGDATPERVAAWKGLGIDRVSFGVQSFDRDVARAAGRRHDAETVRAEAARLQAAGIHRINVDLIAGLAWQTEATWRRDLEEVEALEPDHVSVYMLEIDDESRLGAELRRGGGRYGADRVPSEDETADLYELAVERLGGMGFERYEISNFARPGGRSLHNLKYWTSAPYLGCGADAHSFDGLRRWSNVSEAKDYVDRWRRGEPVREAQEELDDERLLADRVMTGLRLREGLYLDEPESKRLGPRLERLVGSGWLEVQAGGRIRLTDAGVMYSNEALAELLF